MSTGASFIEFCPYTFPSNAQTILIHIVLSAVVSKQLRLIQYDKPQLIVCFS